MFYVLERDYCFSLDLALEFIDSCGKNYVIGSYGQDVDPNYSMHFFEYWLQIV